MADQAMADALVRVGFAVEALCCEPCEVAAATSAAPSSRSHCHAMPTCCRTEQGWEVEAVDEPAVSLYEGLKMEWW